MHKKPKQQKQNNTIHKHGNKGSTLTKEEFKQLKARYKAGKLNFKSKDIVEAMLNDPEMRKGLRK